MMKRFIVLLVCLILCIQPVYANEPEQINTEEKADGPVISAPSAILMEKTTGKIIFEKNANQLLPPASVTKIMTLLLVFDAIEEGTIQLKDEVTVSEYAASMGGSQVFLEPGEKQTVETMIKCISIASANDACVAMGELICGSEESFVQQMNDRAKELGMKETHFVNCNGLDADGHLTTANDIALMSRELILKYPEIRDYCMIWQENITHETAKGISEFGLTNTNKLVRHYEYATGLKTGSTSKAKFCISATGEKDGMEMIAVIMAADDSKKRNKDAITLLNYGFGKCQKYEESNVKKLTPIKVKHGKSESMEIMQKEPFTYIDVDGSDFSKISRKVEIPKAVDAPIKEGEQIGKVIYYMNGNIIGEIPVVAAESMEEMKWKDSIGRIIKRIMI